MKAYTHRMLIVATLATSLIVPNLTRAQVTKAEPAAPVPPPPGYTGALVPLPPAYTAAQDAYGMAMAASEAGLAPAKPSGAALVIPKDRADAKDLAGTEEDLNIMARVLAKAAAGAGNDSRSAMGISIRSSIFGSGASPQNLYLEGYGALFFLNVNYPLIAPPAKAPDAEAKDATSSEWEEARRELYQPRVPGLAFEWANTGSFLGEAEGYDADKVEQLKTELITALKNAVHIRKLKPDETVTIVVTGRSGKAVVKTLRIPKSPSHSGSGGGSSTVAIASSTRDTQRSELILRATRSDIEAFQKGKIDLEEFRKRVTVMSH